MHRFCIPGLDHLFGKYKVLFIIENLPLRLSLSNQRNDIPVAINMENCVSACACVLNFDFSQSIVRWCLIEWSESYTEVGLMI